MLENIINTSKRLALGAVTAATLVFPTQTQGQAISQTILKDDLTQRVTYATELFENPLVITQDTDLSREEADIASAALSLEDIGFTAYRVGDWDDDRQLFLEAWATKRIGDLGVLVDAGKTVNTTTTDGTWQMLSLTYEGALAQALTYADGDTDETTRKTFSRARYMTEDHLFSLGHQHTRDADGVEDTWVPYIKLAGEDRAISAFGNAGEDNFISFKAALNGANPSSYANELHDVLAQQQSIPPFQPWYRPPGTAAGDVTLVGSYDFDDDEGQILLGKRFDDLGIAIGARRKSDSYKGRFNVNFTNDVLGATLDADLEIDHDLGKPRLYVQLIGGGGE